VTETTESLPRVTRFDDQRIELPPEGWPVEVPAFRDERFRSLWHRVLYVAMRAAQRTVYLLPGFLRAAVVNSLAFAGRVFDRRHTEAARDYISTAMPGASSAEVDRQIKLAWRHLLRMAVVSEGVSAKLMGKRLGDHYEVSMCPEAEALVAGKAPAIYVTAHCGYWEASCPGVVGLGAPAPYAIGKAPRNDFVAQHIQEMREGQGMRLIPRNGAMSAVPAALRAGSIVGMLMDHRPRQKPVYAPFFGRPAACDRSTGVLLRRVKVPLVFYGCYSLAGTDPLKNWRFELRFPRVIQPDELRGLGPEEIAARVNSELERLILHRPDEVFWLHDRFKGAPAP
jgi:lauroyl/myristoyl acyltransferase